MSLVSKTLDDMFICLKFSPVYLDVFNISDVIYLINSCPGFEGNLIDRVFCVRRNFCTMSWI